MQFRRSGQRDERRRKVLLDDYRGKYRMWLWMACALTLLSINSVAGLHRALDAVVTYLAGQTLFQFVPGWSLMLISFISGIFVLRTLMDMWRSRGASAAMMGAGLSYIAGALLIVFRPLPVNTMLANMTGALVFSLGHLFLSLSLLVYARRVLLEARGLIQVKKKQPKPKPEKKVKTVDNTSQRQEKQAGDRKLKIDPPHQPSRQAAQPEKSPSASISSNTNSSPANSNEEPGKADKHGPAEDSAEWLKLSKAQRRRIKKLRRRQSTAAA